MTDMTDVKEFFDARVTFHFDGLIVFCFTEDNICQAGILTQAADHNLKISIRAKGDIGETVNTFDYEKHVKPQAPLWLYITSIKSGPPVGHPGTVRRLDCGDYSFDQVLDFEGDEMHSKHLTVKEGVLAPLNIPQGIFYSVRHRKAEVHKVDSGELKGVINKMSTLAAAAIEIEPDTRCSLVLASERWQSTGDEIINFPLEVGQQYEVIIQNSPVSQGHAHNAHANHFHEFYNAFDLPSSEHLMVSAANAAPATMRVRGGTSRPPCETGELGLTKNLPEWTVDGSTSPSTDHGSGGHHH